MTVLAVLGWLPLLIAVAAIGYTAHATLALRTFAREPLPEPARPEPVTLLKPLHGSEPALAANLATFLAQEWSAPIQMLAGTNRADDPALAVARALPNVVVRTDAPAIGANAKICNLANLVSAASHDIVILSDSDMAVPPDYLARVVAALAMPGVGAVTCLYHGRGDAGAASRFAAAAIGWQFTPSVVMSLALRVEHPCMGSTIALRRSTLDAIGGFQAFADLLADDYAIGAAVRRLGLRVDPVPRLLIAHGCVEDSLGAVWRHELRWSATLRAVNRAGHAGSVLTHPMPLGLLVLPFHAAPALVATLAAMVARVLLARQSDVLAGHRPAPSWWLPARDLFSFAVFVASFFARSVDWRGATLRMEGDGRVTAEPELT
ncbi:bacteriohopanetetrol glucosamine biosynthesis glycosyltransferase HpnI [uncultured Sphingomonas sp.]|uniref:bacteriohopanetetrol glucosamine biosynthesis glycosyltransferase HpnI n=1 Tax=uncultured Sphingomonas sp. TaxID=158754 RepID=UPI0035C98D06